MALAIHSREQLDKEARLRSELKDRKQEQVVRRERLSQELSACESEVLTGERVVHAVARFGEILKGLSPDEQKSLVGLFVERVVVKPGKDDPGSSSFMSMRRLQMEFKLNVPRLVDGMEDRVIGRAAAKVAVARGVVVTAQVELGQQGRAKHVAILTPFRCGEDFSPPASDQATVSTAVKTEHPLMRARAWQKLLKQDPELNLRRLAGREGEVAPTLVRHFKLLKLPPEIQSYLARQTDAKAVHFFSLRRLAPLAAMNEIDQLKAFRQMQVEFSLLATKLPGCPSVAMRTEGGLPRTVIRP